MRLHTTYSRAHRRKGAGRGHGVHTFWRVSLSISISVDVCQSLLAHRITLGSRQSSIVGDWQAVQWTHRRRRRRRRAPVHDRLFEGIHWSTKSDNPWLGGGLDPVLYRGKHGELCSSNRPCSEHALLPRLVSADAAAKAVCNVIWFSYSKKIFSVLYRIL